MINKFNQFLFEDQNFVIQYAIDNKDDAFISKLVDKLSFIYKKRKDRYLRPVNVVGLMGDTIEIRVNMSNKDIILFNYKDDELKITINGDIVYHMDEIEKNEIIDKIEKYYKNYIEKQQFVIVNKGNPFN